jgi:hypothetical protein
VGVLTGPSGLVDDDLDVPKPDDPVQTTGEQELAALVREKRGRVLPETFTVASPSGGKHLVWLAPEGREFKTGAGAKLRIAPHIDVRGWGGMFVLWDPDQPERRVIDDRDPVEIPGWLAALHPEPGSLPAGSDGEAAEVSDTEAEAWLDENGGGEPCDRMAEVRDKYLAEFSGTEYHTHDVMLEAVHAVIGECVLGHLGAKAALSALKMAFYKEMAGEPRERERRYDWRSSVRGAIRRKDPDGTGRPADHPCEHDLPPGREEAEAARDTLWADDVAEVRIDWLNKPFLPFGCLVIIDGDPGLGKSVMTTGIVANASAGQTILPGGEGFNAPIKCGMIIDEDDYHIVVGRLRASGYRFDRSVCFLKLRLERRRGKIIPIAFPEGTNRVRAFIERNGLRLAIVDPVASFIGENVKSHNDASVRRALSPLREVARETGCCIVLVRHLNKDASMKALYRGGGSIAFSALARSGMIVGLLPDGSGFGLAQVKCAYAERYPATLAYSVVGWDDDPSIPVISWDGEADVSADVLAKGPQAKRGPDPTSQNMAADVLEQLFEIKDSWPQKEVIWNLEEAGCTTEHKTLDKVRERMGIRSIIWVGKDGKIKGWVWTQDSSKKVIRDDT